jgi:hypothetical protein
MIKPPVSLDARPEVRADGARSVQGNGSRWRRDWLLKCSSIT